MKLSKFQNVALSTALVLLVLFLLMFCLNYYYTKFYPSRVQYKVLKHDYDVWSQCDSSDFDEICEVSDLL